MSALKVFLQISGTTLWCDYCFTKLREMFIGSPCVKSCRTTIVNEKRKGSNIFSIWIKRIGLGFNVSFNVNFTKLLLLNNG